MLGSFSVSSKAREWTAVAWFSLFSGWMLTVAFEGSCFYLRLSEIGRPLTRGMALCPILFLFVGLFTCGALVKTAVRARKALFVLLPICLVGTLLLLTDLGWVWTAVPSILALAAGMVVASWGFWYRSESPLEDRFTVAADIIMLSNVFMIAVDVVGELFGGRTGLGSAALLVLGALFLARRLPVEEPSETSQQVLEIGSRPMVSLFVFVALITVNSGIMYSVFRPAFAQHAFLTTWYWAVPYIAVLLILRKVMGSGNRFQVLMMGVASLGLSFVLFSALDRSVLSFVVIDTFMLGGCGACDLFWWGTLGEMLEGTENSARVFGVGMSANILGIFIGKAFAPLFEGGMVGQFQSTHVASVITIATIAAVPYLYSRLNQGQSPRGDAASETHEHEVDENGKHLSKTRSVAAKDRTEVPDAIAIALTKRELEIVGELLTGKTYKMISEALHVTENTTKYHIKNIYTKLGVRNKTGLLKLLSESEKTGKQRRPS